MNILNPLKKTPLATTWLYLALLLIIWGTGPALVKTCASDSGSRPGCSAVTAAHTQDREASFHRDHGRRGCPGCSDSSETEMGCVPLQRPSQSKRPGPPDELQSHAREPGNSALCARHAATPSQASPRRDHLELLRSVILLI